MIRLSEKLRDIINEQDFCFTSTEIMVVEKALKEFQRYEDTGLTPHEIEAQKHYRVDGMPLMRFVEIITAECDGRLIALPCKVDDTLYEIDLPEYGVITCKVLRVLAANQRYANATEGEIISAVSVLVLVTEGHGEGSSYEFCEEDFGKTVFFSREEAEAALMEGEIK